jgi:hypothetical protein
VLRACASAAVELESMREIGHWRLPGIASAKPGGQGFPLTFRTPPSSSGTN